MWLAFGEVASFSCKGIFPGVLVVPGVDVSILWF